MDSIDLSNEPNSANQPSAAAINETPDSEILGGCIWREKTSKYRGVNKAKDKASYVAHIYDNGCKSKHSRTIYLGRFVKEEDAAKAHDLASLKFWGTAARTNFPLSEYTMALKKMKNMSDQEVIAAVRRASNSFSRGTSKYRGVVKYKPTGKWQSRKGPGKDYFLGTYDTEVEAAFAYDIAIIKKKGYNAITNFDLRFYNVEAILEAQQEEDVKESVPLRTSDVPGTFRESLGVGCHKKKRAVSSQLSPVIQGDQIWAPEISRKELADASASRFQHGSFSPFCSYQEMIQMQLSRELKETSALGFQHASSSAIQCYQLAKPCETSNKQEVIYPLPIKVNEKSDCLPHYQIDFFREQELRALEMGFQHASSSAFQCYQLAKPGETSNTQEVIYPLPINKHRRSDSLPPYQIDSFSEQELRALELGLQHASSSCFNPYSLPPYHIDILRELELRALGQGFQHAGSSCFKRYKSNLEGNQNLNGQQ